jgi:hypothetical protein
VIFWIPDPQALSEAFRMTVAGLVLFQPALFGGGETLADVRRCRGVGQVGELVAGVGVAGTRRCQENMGHGFAQVNHVQG